MRTNPVEHICIICGVKFLTKNYQQISCGYDCGLALRRTRHKATIKSCVICKAQFKKTSITKNSKTCSTSCQQINIKNRDTGITIKVCIICEINFTALGKSKTCSKLCSKTLNAARVNKKYRGDILFKLCDILRSRVRHAIKNNQKSGSAVKDLGCSIEELKTHLESKFLPDMTWDNWSKDGWHIDHITPLISFDLSNREEFLKACHYTNLQPLWAKDNISKGGRHV